MFMFEKGQIWLWENRLFIVDDVWKYSIHSQGERITGKMREFKEGNEISLNTIHINFNQEKGHLSHIGDMEVGDYVAMITAAWHKAAPETMDYVVCSMDAATHVVFSPTDLKLAGEDGNNFSPNQVYSIHREQESGDFIIIDDKKQPIVGFDLFIPCEYLKENKSAKPNTSKSKVVNLSDYIKMRNKK